MTDMFSLFDDEGLPTKVSADDTTSTEPHAVVVETPWGNHTHTIDEGTNHYAINFADEEMDGSDFQDAVQNGTVEEDFELVPKGTISIPIVHVRRKGI